MPEVEDFRTERTCPKCQYPIRPGWFHEERPQPEGANVTVCSLRRANGAILRGPLVDVLTQYLDEAAQRDGTGVTK